METTCDAELLEAGVIERSHLERSHLEIDFKNNKSYRTSVVLCAPCANLAAITATPRYGSLVD